jgi:hypothetical protein
LRCLVGKCWRVTGTDGCSATRWLVKMHANDARVEPCPSSIDLHSLTLTAITALETRKLAASRMLNITDDLGGVSAPSKPDHLCLPRLPSFVVAEKLNSVDDILVRIKIYIVAEHPSEAPLPRALPALRLPICLSALTALTLSAICRKKSGTANPRAMWTATKQATVAAPPFVICVTEAKHKKTRRWGSARRLVIRVL